MIDGLIRSVASNLLNLLIFAFLALAGFVAWGKNEFTRPGPLERDVVFVVERGSSISGIADRLEDRGIISDARIFRIGARFLEQQEDFKFGEYSVAAGSSMKDVLDLVTSGRGIVYVVTIPEGFTVHQVVARLDATEELEGEVEEIPEEGSLAPDTYAVSRGESRQSVIDRMRRAQVRILDNAWETRRDGIPLASPEEALILASIVEKETGKPSERGEIAAVFMNRLRHGWRLQSDPTVIYGLTMGKEIIGRGLRESELARETPYNTYVISGLPPTPITNPGRAAIEATLNPSETDNMFFVADGEGGHLFASTLAEHNRNVARWRRIERERRNE